MRSAFPSMAAGRQRLDLETGTSSRRSGSVGWAFAENEEAYDRAANGPENPRSSGVS
jgi:hypothetical protein